MTRPLLCSAMLIALVAGPTFAAEDDSCDALFVVRAQGLRHEGSRMVLENPDPRITWFCDRPVRQAGHMTIDALLGVVSQAENSFAENPPNAAVSVFGPDGSVTDAVVVLPSAPVVGDKAFDFEVELLEGELPKQGGSTVLFIDPLGVPVGRSVMGVHRRHERRDNRQDRHEDRQDHREDRRN